MPFFYDLEYSATTNATGGNSTIQMAGKQIAQGSTLGIYGIIAAARLLTAGGGTLMTKTNTAGGTVFSGGTAQTPTRKNAQSENTATSTWVNAGSTITAGTTLVQRNAVGFAQTGGTGGLQPIMQQAAIQVVGGTTPNPVDIEFNSIAVSTSVPLEITLEIGEDI